MEHRYLGTTGLLVSEFSLGTMTFGAPGWGCTEEESHRIIASFLDHGGTTIDTADVYAGGETERIIGSFLPNIRRDDVVIASKCNFPAANNPLAVGSARKHIVASVEASLRRLGTDYLDVYYLHRNDPTVRAEEIAETFDLLIRQGKVLYPALSNLPAWRMVHINQALKSRATTPFVAGQYMYNLVDRTAEQELIPAMVSEGIGMVCWSPLAGGLLTGKYKGVETVPADSRFEYRKALDVPRFWTERSLTIARKLMALSQERTISPVTLSLGWLLSKPYVTSVIVGARTLSQLTENLSVDWRLIPSDMLDLLDQLSEPERSYFWTFNEETNTYFANRGRPFPGMLV
ncbi:MAG: aldo/keto reductase [Sphaerochaeta sp.]|jgi:aryl-alcohol dehydrogenase-like predicted oxidoreductase|nr:aldo/keto reductase [Sphaerochaeta sp.]MDX9916014.1 aldo/keto reductase [Sphaerochaeta sp.]